MNGPSPLDPPLSYRGRTARFTEATTLVAIGPDYFGRPAHLAPEAAVAWLALSQTTQRAGLDLRLISAFRSIERQTEIIRRKLSRGETWDEILRVSAYPGFSEHHTGCAIDLGSPDCADLTEDFATTREFAWLEQHASNFGFLLSYPPGNPDGMAYEPWHWRWHPTDSRAS